MKTGKVVHVYDGDNVVFHGEEGFTVVAPNVRLDGFTSRFLNDSEVRLLSDTVRELISESDIKLRKPRP